MRTHRFSNVQETLLDAATYLIRLGYTFEGSDHRTHQFARDGQVRRVTVLRNGTCKIA